MADFDYLPEGLWGDEYRDAGGIVVPDFLRQQAQQRQSMADLYTGEPEAPPEPPAPEQEFYDWPKYHALVGAKGLKPYEAYDEYVSIALPQQLKDMGYSDDEIRQGVAQFTQMVPAPAADYGFFGNLWESVKGGAGSGTRAEKATGNLATGNLDAIAKLVTESATGGKDTAPLQQFNESLFSDEAKKGLGESISAWSAVVDNPQGAFLWLVNQAAQSYPSIVGGLGGAAVGSLGGPLGTLAGGAAGVGAGSASVEIGSQILERIAHEAQARGINPSDTAAVRALIQDPEVYNDLRNAALAKGFTVGAFDAATTVVSMGLGKAAVTAARAGRGLRSTGMVAGGLGAEVLGGAGGEAASQLAAGDPFSYPDIVAEAMGELIPGAANIATGAMFPTKPGVVPSVNPPIEPELDEGGLAVNNTEPIEPPPLLTPNVMRGRPPPGFGVTETPGVEEITVPPVQGATPFEQMEVTEPTVEEITIEPAQFVDSAEARIAEGRLLTFQPNAPLVADSAGQVGTPQQMEQQRLSQLTTPQATDLNIKDANSVAQWLEDRGVVLTPTQHAIAEDLAGTPPRQRREYIASVIDDLIASPDANAESLAHGLLAIANTLPKDPAPKPADAAAALARDLKVPIEDVPKAAVSLLMQEMAAAIESGVTNATETQGPAATAAPTTAAGAAVARRGLRRGEPLPGNSLADLVHDIAGSGAVERAQTPQKQSRGGLRSRVAQEGAGQRGKPLARAEAAAPGQGPGSARTVAVDTSGAPGVPRVIRGLRYGAQETDVANAESLAAEREAARARKQTGGLSKKAKKGLSRKVVTKKEYEETYPGRDLDKDVDELFDNPIDWESQTPLSESAKRTIESAPFSSVMEYLSAVMSSPLQRRVAERIRDLDIAIPIRVAPVSGTQSGVYTTPSVLPGRKTNVGITIDPRKASLKTVLHEAVHAATVSALRYPQTAEQRAAGQRMRELHEYVSKQPGAQAHYGVNPERGEIGTVEEFVAEAFSNPEFQKYLNSLQLPNAPKKVTAWTAFKQFVMDLIGRPTVLSEVLIHGEDLFSAEQRGAGSALFDQPRAAPSTAILGTKDGARTFIAYAKSKDDPNTTYTLYPTTNNLRGDKDAGIPNLTREQAERYIEAQGSQPIAPASDTSIKSGTPKNTSTKLVGYGTNGDLQSIAFEQKDGTWTYYESDADVRSDPEARVSKGLPKDQVQRTIAARGLVGEPPTRGAVRANAETPTPVGYTPAGWARRQIQDVEGTLKNIGSDVETASTLRNSRFDRVWRKALRTYVEPARAAGERISQQFGKTQEDIETLLQKLHVAERMQVKVQQVLRGKDPQHVVKEKVTRMQEKQTEAEQYVNDTRNSNAKYVQAVKQEFAPKIKQMADNTIDLAAQYGLLSREVAENIKKTYDYYVPLQVGERTTSGKAATGTNTKTDKSFARMVQQLQGTIARGEQNRVRKAVLDLVRGVGLVNLETKESPVQVLEDNPDIKPKYDPETNSISEVADSHTFDENAIDVFIDGQRTRMIVSDPSLLAALHPFKPGSKAERHKALTIIAGTWAGITRMVSIGKTTLNPAWPPYNFARDVLTANVNMPLGVSRLKYNMQLANPLTYSDVAYNLAREAVGMEPTGTYAKAKDDGAFITHRAFLGMTEEVARATQALFNPPIMRLGVSQKGTKVADWGSKLFDVLSVWPQLMESVPRYAVYKAALASGQSAERAAVAAKNASVNFENRGERNLSNYWIFGNAKMQGVHALAQTYKRMGPVKAALGASAIVALGVLAASIGYDRSEKDKDGKSKYGKMPDYKKDSLVLFKEGEAGIPIPQEISPLYVLGHAAQEARLGGITIGKATQRFLTATLNNLWPGSVAQQDPIGHKANAMDFLERMVLPSNLMPMHDTSTNKNTFGGEVVRGKEDKLKRGIPLHEMGSPTENQLAVNTAKGLSDLTNGAVDVAPQQLKLWHNYFDPATEGYAFVRDLFGGREPKYVGDIVNPFARKFVGAATDFYDQDQFDELLAKATRAKYLAEQKGINALDPEDQVLARSAAMLSKVNSDGNNLFKGSKLLEKDRRDLLNERKREMILDGIRRYNELRDRTIPKQ